MQSECQGLRLRVFVSFTKQSTTESSDACFVRRLIARLSQHSLDVWNYEDDEDELEGGVGIKSRLQDTIDKCHIFVPVISANVFRSKYTRIEVDYAIRRFRNLESPDFLKIIPIVSQRLIDERESWPMPYSVLRDIRSRHVDFDATGSLEDVLIDLCNDFGIEYKPLCIEHALMPFYQSFLAEVRDRFPRHKERENGIFCRLMRIHHRFSIAIQEDRHCDARRLITYFCLMCEHEYPAPPFYYPNLVRGVCESLNADWGAAQTTFQEATKHPNADESSWGGLGYVALRRRDFRTSLDHYTRANSLCPDDPSSLCGILLSSVFLALPDIEAKLLALESCESISESLSTSVDAVRAIALATLGRLDDAQAILVRLSEQPHIDVDVIVRLAQVMVYLDDCDGAIELLLKFCEKRDEVELWHEMAIVAGRSGRFDEAIAAYNYLIGQRPLDRRFRAELSQIHVLNGCDELAYKLAKEQLDSLNLPTPVNFDDFYYDGQANWLCGRKERADYDFWRSRYPETDYYGRLLPLGRSS